MITEQYKYIKDSGEEVQLEAVKEDCSESGFYWL